MNLRQVAKFLKEQGIINAINLDGGGSATYILNGSLASYPSDHWCVHALTYLGRLSQTIAYCFLCSVLVWGIKKDKCWLFLTKSSLDVAMWRCPRAVSTVLCVHERLCQPEDCSGHGRCIDGRCECQRGWSGPGCANLTCQSPECGDHGICTESESLSRSLLYFSIYQR